MSHLIAYPGDRPPCVVDHPGDLRGTTWRYEEPTPDNAVQALADHARWWPDWTLTDTLLDDLAVACDPAVASQRIR